MRSPTDEIGTLLVSIRIEGFCEDLADASAGDGDEDEWLRFAK